MASASPAFREHSRDTTALATVSEVAEGTGPRLSLPPLTGLRILAALAVYASHIGAPSGSPRPLTTFFASGYMGVTVFFVLSGFVLAINYFERLRRPSLRRTYDYVVARFARIYPLYLLVIFYFVVRGHALGVDVGGWWRDALAIQAWDPDLAHAYSLDPPAWSISVEIFLYACFPLLVPAMAGLKRPRAILLTAAAVALGMLAIATYFALSGRGALPIQDPGSAHRWLYRTPLTRLGDFALGILAARLYVTTHGDPLVRRIASPLLVGSLVVGLALMAWPAIYLTSWSWDSAYALPAAVLIFALATAPTSLMARGLSLPAVVLLGEASYAFYLIHAPGVGVLGGSSWATSMSLTAAALQAMTLAILLALAVGLHVTFEGPARTYIRRALGRVDRRGRCLVTIREPDEGGQDRLSRLNHSRAQASWTRPS